MFSIRSAAVVLLLLFFRSTSHLPTATGQQTAGTGEGVSAAVTPEGVLVSESGRKVLFFQTQPRSLDGMYTRAAYVHPLWDLDGNVLTEDFPEDHPHHRGIFWAWHQLTVGGTRAGDPWVCRGFLAELSSQGVKVQQQKNGTLRLDVPLLWKSPHWTTPDGQRKAIVREQTAIVVHPVQSDFRMIDFEIALTAMEADVRIGGSSDDKGYGGFSTRLRLPDGLKFQLQSGEVEPQRTPVEPSPWLNMTAAFGEDSKRSSVCILTHPSTPGFPQRWILRQKRSMQNGVFPGRKPVTLPPGQPLKLRYRLVLHRAEVSGKTVDLWQSEYGKNK